MYLRKPNSLSPSNSYKAQIEYPSQWICVGLLFALFFLILLFLSHLPWQRKESISLPLMTKDELQSRQQQRSLAKKQEAAEQQRELNSASLQASRNNKSAIWLTPQMCVNCSVK